MRIAICDDNELIRNQIYKLVQKYFAENHLKCPEIAFFENGESLLQDTLGKDIVFLDIEMPGLDGIYVGNELRKANSKIIIFVITSFIEYLDEAMRFQVFRYLTKPIDKHRFYRNFTDALSLYNSSENIKIPIETKQGVFTVSINDLITVEAQARKVLVHTVSKSYESVETMDYWKQKLTSNNFFQTHRSFIVNMRHVTSFDHSLISLNNGQIRAYLTKRKYTQFKNAYLIYAESLR